MSLEIIQWKVKNCGDLLLPVPACLLKFEKSATKRLIQQIFDKLQPDTLKSRQICLNACGFYREVGGQMETEYCTLA